MAIYVCTNTRLPEEISDNGYKPIIGGGCFNNKIPNYLIDNKGPNISELNPSFNEFTVLYWIWKNTNDDIVGLCHYRRFFTTNIADSFKYRGKYICSYDFFEKSMSNIDVFVKEPCLLRAPNLYKNNLYTKNHSILQKEHYETEHRPFDLFSVRQTIKKLSPEYIEAYDFFLTSRLWCNRNMFVMKRQYFDQYMEWIFPILFNLKKEINTDSYDTYDKRFIGIISERLFNVWICHNRNKLKIGYLRHINFDLPYEDNYLDLKEKKIKLKKDKRKKIKFKIIEKLIFMILLLINISLSIYYK